MQSVDFSQTLKSTANSCLAQSAGAICRDLVENHGENSESVWGATCGQSSLKKMKKEEHTESMRDAICLIAQAASCTGKNTIFINNRNATKTQNN